MQACARIAWRRTSPDGRWRALAQRHGVPIAVVFPAADENGDLARELAGFVRDQAFAIGTAVALFSPDAIVLGGGVCAMQGFPKLRLAALVEANAPFAETGRRMDLRWAELGWRSALHGAPHAAREHFWRRQQHFDASRIEPPAGSAGRPGHSDQTTSTGGAP